MMEFFVLLIELLGVSRLVRRVGLPWAIDVPSGVSNVFFRCGNFKTFATSECLADQVCFAFPFQQCFFVFRVVCVVS